MRGGQARPGYLLDRAPVLGQSQPNLVGRRSGLDRTEFADQSAGVDSDRAGNRACAITGAGLDSVVLVLLLQLGEHRRSGRLAGHFTPEHDPLPWRHGDVTARTNRFAKSALDALRSICDTLDLRHRFQILQMEFCIAGQDHVRSQNAFRVGELLDPPHHGGGLCAPFQLEERRHIETGAVLGLQRAVVLADDEIDEFFHEGRVPLVVLWIAEVRDQREVKVSVGCVAGNSGDEAVLAEQFLEVLGPLGQALWRKAHVLGYERRALGTQFSDQSEQSFAYAPRQLDGFLHACEFDRMNEIGVGGQLDDPVLQNLERSHVFGAELHKQGRSFRIESFPIGGGTGEGLAGGSESRGDHQLNGGGPETDEAGDEADRFIDGWDRYPGDAGHTGRRNGVDQGLGDERQRPLRSHEKTTKDFEWRLAVEQSAEPVAMGVPDRILSSHAVNQFPIGEQLSAELQQPDRKIRFGPFECRLRVGRRGVDYGAGWRYERHRRDGLIGVVFDGAAHAAGVVGYHATDGTSVRTGRIRSDPFAVSPEHRVDVSQDHSWARAHPAAVLLHFGAVPMTAHVDEYIVRLGLTVQTGSRGAECRVPSVLRQ